MPTIEILKPPDRSSFTDNLLIHEHGIANVSAAYLLVIGRRAIHAYASARGQDLELLVPILADTICAWVAANGGCRDAVSDVAKRLDDMMLLGDFPAPTPVETRQRAVVTRPSTTIH